MKTLLIILTLITLTAAVQSQVYREWVQRYGRAGNISENPNRIGIDRSGNIICINNTQPGNNADIDLLKYNSSGANLWIQPFNGVQNENDYAEMLYIDDSSKIYYGGSRNQAFAGQACDPYIRKYNTNGTLQWDVSFNSTSEYGHITNMFTDVSGNITFVGFWGGFTPNIDVHLRKLTPGGSQIWSNQWVVPGQREDGNCVVRDASGNIYTAGGLNPPTATDIFVKKYDSFGTTLWTSLFNGSLNKADYVYSGGLAVDNSSNVYALGIANVNDIWNPGGNADAVLLKYNSAGVLQWSRYIAGTANDIDYPGGIVIDPSNNIYITSYIKNTVTNYD
ncbi:MAG: SBBP repeat-containing protein, partial [Ignavibacteria bacterium]|nr:SBBP repeat-containing protein [Ignavibacteria bacterium]